VATGVAATDMAAPKDPAASARIAGGLFGTADTPGASGESPPQGPAPAAPAPDAGVSTSGPQSAAEEELEVVLGRRLLRGPLQVDVVPFP